MAIVKIFLQPTADGREQNAPLGRAVIAESDVAQAKTQLDTARVQATDIMVRRAQYEHAIAVLVGQSPASFALAAAPLESQPPTISNSHLAKPVDENGAGGGFGGANAKEIGSQRCTNA